MSTLYGNIDGAKWKSIPLSTQSGHHELQFGVLSYPCIPSIIILTHSHDSRHFNALLVPFVRKNYI